MRQPVVLAFAALGLTGCVSSNSGINPSSAKADNSAFMSGLSAPSHQLAMYCQDQLQKQLGGTVYIVAAPSLQKGGSATTAGEGPTGSTNVVYDHVMDGKTTTGSSTCAPPAGPAGSE